MPTILWSSPAARRVLLLRAFESDPGADNPLWTADDSAWATRLARDTAPENSGGARFLDERAMHALQRLLPRDPGVARVPAQRLWRPWWLVAALVGGFAAGIAIDAIGGAQEINLLAPPVWAVIAWNLVVYLALVLPLPRSLPRRLAQQLLPRQQLPPNAGAHSRAPLAAFHGALATHAAPLLLARAALLLHAAAAALALGLIAGLYLRGLVFDFRVGWQSTFLDASQVHAALSFLLAPAVAATGIGVPDAAALQALRVAPGAVPVASAAPWIHLYAAMLTLCVVLPRAVLALLAAVRALIRSRRIVLPLHEPYFQRLLREQRGDAARVQVVPHGTAPSPQALAGLQAVLAAALGSRVQVDVTAAAAYGSEDDAASALEPAAGTTLRLVLVDLASTPEDDAQGALVRSLRAAAPAVPHAVLADEGGFRSRFGALPARLSERRAGWQRWALAHEVGLASADLRQPDLAQAEAALQAALLPQPQPSRP